MRKKLLNIVGVIWMDELKLRYIKTSQLAEDALKLIKYLPAECAGIVGIPRSGFSVASILASICHLPLFELTECGPVQLGNGFRGHRSFGTGFPVLPGKYFVVDDSSHNGGSIQKARKQMEGYPAIFGVVYALSPDTVDIHVEQVDSPHLFEWNIWNNGLIPGMAQDPALRGGMCFDFSCFCDKEGNPRYLPRMLEIPLAFSDDRKNNNQQWLDKWQIRVKRLVFNVNKAVVYRESKCCFMLNYEKEESKQIADTAKKPVICVKEGIIYDGK